MKNTCWVADGVRKLKDGEIRTALLFAFNGDEAGARDYALKKMKFTEVYSVKKMN